LMKSVLGLDIIEVWYENYTNKTIADWAIKKSRLYT